MHPITSVQPLAGDLHPISIAVSTDMTSTSAKLLPHVEPLKRGTLTGHTLPEGEGLRTPNRPASALSRF